MRSAFSLLLVLAVAVALALLAGNNPGTVTVFWPPHRIDLSFNFALLLVLGGFLVLHLALRALAALFALPTLARRWRLQQRERAMFGALLDALSHLMAGRFIRARKSAELALEQEARLLDAGDPHAHGPALRSMAHLLAAESAHALLDKDGRAAHWNQAAAEAPPRNAQEEHEAVQLRAVRWAVDDHNGEEALRRLAELPAGAARRTVALRMRLKAARQAGRIDEALDTARLLVKHRAFSDTAGQTLIRGLVIESLAACTVVSRLQALWEGLEPSERARPDLAVAAARRWLDLGGSPAQAAEWLLPSAEQAWEQARAGVGAREVAAAPATVPLVQTLARTLMALGETDIQPWLARIERSLQQQPGNPLLHYLAAHAGFSARLWGKAGQWIDRCLPALRGTALEPDAWRLQAHLAEQRGDAAQAAQAWKKAAQEAA